MARFTPWRIGECLATLIILLLLGTGCVPSQKPPQSTPVPAATLAPATGLTVSATSLPDHSQAKVPVLPSDLVQGRADAKVTVVEFLDLQCPFCGRVQPTLKGLQAKYGDELRWVTKHNPLPFHNHAFDAALAVATVRALAGNGAAQKYVDLILAHQTEISDDLLETLAEPCGVARVIYQEAMASRRFSRLVDADLALAKQLGSHGTPGFFINGVALSGAQSIETFSELIEAQILAADGLLAQGVPRAELYPRLTGQNFQVATAPQAPAKTEDLTVWKLPVSASDPTLGPRDAPVTVVVFSDFECPYCARAHATLKSVREKYGSSVRLVWKDNPLAFHANAHPAAVLGRWVYEKKGDSAFWDYASRVFEHQDRLSETLAAEAKQAGALLPQLRASKAGKQLTRRIEESQELAADFGAKGTPNFFINGVRLEGSQPLDAFSKRIDAALAEAEKLSSQGIPAKLLYETLTKDGKAPEPPERKEVALPKVPRPTRGAALAPVTLQLFSDFQCPFCKRMVPVISQLEKEFPGQLRIIWRHMPLPFHEHASLAAQAAEAAFAQRGSHAFWAFHDKLFEHQSTDDGLTRASLERIAQELSLDLPAFRKALDEGTYLPVIEADIEAGQAAGITGTPATSIGSYFLSGAQPVSAFRRVVRLALSSSKVGRNENRHAH